jgi:hypothetical protein
MTAAMLDQLPPEDRQPPMIRWADGLTLRMALGLLVHAGVVAWTVPLSRETWLFWSGPGQFIIIAVQFVFEGALLKWHVLPQLRDDPPNPVT